MKAITTVTTFLVTCAVTLAIEPVTSLEQAAALVRENETYSDYIESTLIDKDRPYMTPDEHQLAQQARGWDHAGRPLKDKQAFEPSPTLKLKIQQHAREHGLTDPFDQRLKHVTATWNRRKSKLTPDQQLDRLMNALEQEKRAHQQSIEQQPDPDVLIKRIEQLEQTLAENNTTSQVESQNDPIDLATTGAAAGLACMAGVAGTTLFRRRKQVSGADTIV